MTKDLLIVAAGTGSRLKSAGNLKPLVEVQGTPLIARALNTAFQAGVNRAIVVTGYNADVLEKYLAGLSRRTGWRIDTVYNADYQKPNGLSVLKAKDALKETFFLTMCDHMVEKGLYDALLQHDLKADTVALGVDRRMDNPFVDLEDVTKVQTDGAIIKEIGKMIPAYNAFDTGVFRATPALFDAIEHAGANTGDYGISGGMLQLAAQGKAIAVDIGAQNWIDVDSPEMLEMAEEWAKNQG